MEEKGAEYYNRLFKENTDMSRYVEIYQKIGEMTDHTMDIGCGLAELRKYVKDYNGFDIADEIIPEGCFVGSAYDKENYKGDTFTCTEVLEHIDDKKVIENLPDGARFIFTVPSFEDPSHLRTYNIDRVKDLGLDLASITRFNWHGKWTQGEDTDSYILLVDSYKREPKLSVAMIVKNEEVMLEAALKTVKDADEIVIVDTGSTDKTVEIAQKYGKVYHHKWRDSFAEARNYSNSKCTGDWIIAIDADEEMISSIADIRREIKRTTKNSLRMNVTSGKEKMRNVRIFKRGIKWAGSAHNYLVGTDPEDTELELKYGYSPAHKADPDRTLRILLKNHPTAREKFYLAREYLYRKDYDNALKWYKKYIKESNFREEICEAYLQMARCKWAQHKGQEARDYLLKAIEGNPNFKEALLFMAEMSWEKQATVWKKFAEIATNEDVLFIR